MHQYVALLRGINVGGKNKIRMADLAACFEAHGHADVRTYIQSGNVMFRSREADRATLTAGIEEMLSSTFGYSAVVTLRSHEELRLVVDGAPGSFGTESRVLPLRRVVPDASTRARRSARAPGVA